MIASQTRPNFKVREPPPVFNKRLYKAQAGIVLTDEILQILQKSLTERRLPEQLHAIKPVVSALKDIHRGLQYIKEALGHVVTYEKVDANTEICKKWGENCLSCYYILSGSVEASYALNNNDMSRSRRSMRKSNDCEINYTHVAGEYLGLVSGEGPEFDYPPPDCIRTMEVSEFLRVDREQFHKDVKRVQNRYVREIQMFFEEVDLLKSLPTDEKNKLVSLMARQEYPAGKVVVNQGDVPEHVFFVAKGRCQYYRKVFIDEINREELVKLGQIEKGEFFGESSALDSSPCFCSVASVGPVTCFLVNKWAIKTNEHIIRILRQNRRCFFTDSDIKHYIRDSDIWQSFKRYTVTGLLETAGKCHMTVDRGNMTPPLSRAVDYGDAKRSSLHQPNHDDEIPGAPKKAEQLFVPPRSRRRSSAILNCGAAAVVKAVLLLRLKPETDSDSKFKSSFSVTGPSFQEHGRYSEEWPKPRSAPGRKFRHDLDSGLTATMGHRAKSAEVQLWSGGLKHRSFQRSNTLKFSKPDESLPRIRTKSGKEKKELKGAERNVKGKEIEPLWSKYKSGSGKEKVIPSSKISAKTKKSSTGLAKEIDTSNQPTSLPSIADEKIITQKPNVVVREIINTGLPGRRMSPTSYRRFDKSMFDILDKQANKDADEDSVSPHTPPLNLWNVSFAASKWMSSVRQQRRNAHAQELDDLTSQPPIIVIEDWSPEVDTQASSKRNEQEPDSPQLFTSKKMVGRKPSRTPTPVLDDVTEESEEEVQKYEGDIDPFESWYTCIHEARDECAQHLNDVKKQVESLEKRRNSLKSQQRKKGADNECSENKLQEDKVEANGNETETQKTEDNHASEKSSSRQEKRKVSRKISGVNFYEHAGAGRNRANTTSEVQSESPKDPVEYGRQLRRTQSLSRVRLIHVSTPSKHLRQHSSNHESAMEDQMGRTRANKDAQRISVEPSRLEKRKQLLRKKLEEIEKRSKSSRHLYT